MDKTQIKVLLIENDPDDMNFVRDALQKDPRAEYRLTVVERLRDGWNMIQQGHFDIVLLDLNLPDSRGLDTFKQLKKTDSELPVVILSSRMEEEAALQAFELGAQDYVVKGAPGWDDIARVIRYAIERRQSEQARLTGEARFRNLFEYSPAAIWEEDFSQVKEYLEALKNCGVTDLEAHFSAHPEAVSECIQLVQVRDVNRAALDMYETTDKSELLGGLEKTLPPESFMGFRREFLIIGNGEPGFHSETFLRTFRGNLRNVDLHWVVAPGCEQTYSKVLVSLTDITARKQAETDLRAAEVKYRALVERLPSVIYTSELGKEGVWSYVSPQIERLLGFSPEEWMADSRLWYQQVHPVDRDRQEALEEQSYQSDRKFESEYRIFTRAGHEIWVRDSGIILPSQNGSAPIVQGVLTDVTERKQAEEALQEREFWLKESQRVGRIGSYNLDLTTNEWTSSEVLDDIFGIDPDSEKTVLSWNALVHPEERAEMLQYFTYHVIEGRQPFNKEYRIMRVRDGAVRWVWGQGELSLDANGIPLKMFGTIQDITERKRAEEELRESERRARELFETASRQARDLDLLDRVRSVISEQIDLPLLLRRVVESIAETFGFTQVSLYLLEGEELDLQHQVGYERVISRIPIDKGVCGRVVRTGKPILLQNATSDPEFLGAIEGITSEICVPLWDGGEVTGVLNVESTQGIELKDTELNLMIALSEQIGVGIGRVRLYESVQRKNRILSALQESTLAVIGDLDLNNALEAIVEQAAQLMDTSHGYVYLVQPDEQTINLVMGVGGFSDHIGTSLKPHEGLAGKIWQSGQPLTVREYVNWNGQSSQFSNSVFHAVTGIPLMHEARVIGVLGLAHAEPGKTFNAEDVELLNRFTELASIALVNAGLYKRAQDELAERKQAEEALQRSEEKYRKLAEQIPAIVYVDIAEGAGKTLYISPKVETILGYTPQAWIENPDLCSNIIHPDDLQRVIAETRNRQVGEQLSLDYRYLAKDGRTVWVRDEAVLMRGEGGQPDIWQGLLVDITVQKQIEEALRDSEERYRGLFENMPIAIWEEDFSPIKRKMDLLKQQGVSDFRSYLADHSEVLLECASLIKILDLNRAALLMYRAKSRDELIRSAQEDMNEGELELLQEGLIAIANGTTNYSMEGLDKTMTGEPIEINLSWSVVPGHEDDYSKVIITTTDITDRKQAEQALRESEERFRLVTWATTDVVWDRDLQTDQIEWGAGMQKTFHYLPEGIRADQQWWLDHVHPQDRDNVDHSIRQALEASWDFWSKEYRFQRADGIYANIMDRGYILYNDIGKPYRIIGAMMDITARKQAEEAVRDSEERYRGLFEDSPISLWEEDFSAVKQYLDALRATGVTDFRTYFESHSQEVAECANLVKIVDVNKATLELYGAKSKQDLFTKLTQVFQEESYAGFLTELVNIAEGHAAFVWEGINQTLDGRRIETSLGWSVAPGHEDDLSKVILSVVDVTEQKRAEADLKRRVTEMEALHENGLAISRLLVPELVGQKIVEVLAQKLHWHHAAFRLYNAATDQLELVALNHPGLSQPQLAEQVRRLRDLVSDSSRGLTGWAVQRRSPIRTGNLTKEPRYVETYPGMCSGLYVPVMAGGNVVGVISVESETENAFTEQDERLLVTLASQSAIAIENAQLYLMVQRELEERQQAEAQLRESEAQLRQSEEKYRRLAAELEQRVYEQTAEVQDLYNNAPCGYHSLDGSGNVIRVNETELKWLGYTRDEMLNQPFTKFIAGESRSKFIENFPAFKKNGSRKDNDLEIDLLRKDGATLPALISATVLYDQEGRYLTSRSTLFDNTERKHALETLCLANNEMKRALRTKDEFLANMSHELRTPLNAILGLSESLLEQTAGPLNEKQQKYLTIVHESGAHLLELINDILDLAKVEAGQIKLDPGKVDINSVCQSSLRMIKQLAQKKNQTVEVQVENNIGYILADERRLKQMIVNLLSNAVKFTPEGGTLGLNAQVDRKEAQLLINIWDRGIGIRAEDLPRLFQPFVQLDSSLSRESSGTGLGLALVAQMARLHGGSVSVSSKPGEGSRFSLVLPWDPAITSDTLEKFRTTGRFPTVKSLPGKPETILIVEDTDSVVMLVRDYLELAGYKVAVARDGVAGVSRAISLQPDLILMDVQMPGMDGLEATRRIRQENTLRHTPIFALTALAMTSDRERCIEAGMNDYISKPVNLRQLVKMIQSHLSGSKIGVIS